MKTKRILFDVLFIIISAVILLVLNEYGLLEKYAQYALIPIIFAYSLGQYVERNFQISKNESKPVD